jgi:CBS-domain-containing membrane protein
MGAIRSSEGGPAATYARDVAADTIVQNLIPMLADSELPLRVVDGDRPVGVVDRSAVLHAMMES